MAHCAWRIAKVAQGLDANRDKLLFLNDGVDPYAKIRLWTSFRETPLGVISTHSNNYTSMCVNFRFNLLHPISGWERSSFKFIDASLQVV